MYDEVDYLDFEITVQKNGNDYLLRAESGSGQAEVIFTNPFNEDKRALIGATLTKVALRSSAKTRSSSAPEVKKMKELGSVLFHEAITGPVREFYYKCQGQADQQGKGIRWRLSLDPSVSDLPWEFLYLQDEFLALNPRSPVVRFIKGAGRVAPLKAEHPMRVLVVIASPSDEVPLDTAAEKDRINAALQPLTANGLVDVTFIEGPDTWERLIDALLPNQTHILHFIGHGAFDEKNSEGVLVMEDADGKAIRIDSERLRVLVQGKSRLRLVVLNSCLGTQGDEAQPFSSMAAGLVRSGIPAVIAMQFEISDHAAREIAETFYRSIALNLPVDAAVTEARRKIFLSDRDSLEWATPILFMQVPDGRLFQFQTGTTAAPVAPRESESEVPPTSPLRVKTQKTPRVRTATATPAKPKRKVEADESLGAKAERRYNDGNEAMARGEWAEAVKAFTGALYFVPHYKDAEQKLSTCKDRDQAFNLFNQAQDLCAEKNYYQALRALDEVAKLDASIDTAEVRTAAEVGQKYNRALGELQARNPANAAVLLREIVSAQPDFEDAAARLENLSNGGDGLTEFTMPAAPPRKPGLTFQPVRAPQPNMQAPPPQQTEWHVYDIAEPNTQALAEEIRQYFFSTAHESQIIQQDGICIVQGKKAGWRTWVGMGQAATVMIERTASGLKVSVGGGKWVEQGAAIAVAMFVLWPLLITGGVGMAQQKQLMDTLWRIADDFVSRNGGRRVQ